MPGGSLHATREAAKALALTGGVGGWEGRSDLLYTYIPCLDIYKFMDILSLFLSFFLRVLAKGFFVPMNDYSDMD